MRKPRVPPAGNALDKLLEHSDEAKFAAVFSQSFGPLVTGRYMHWDKLRRLEPPQGLSHEDWWFGLKLQRERLYETLPLQDEQNRPFKFAVVPPIPQRLHEIDQGGGGIIQMPEQVLNPDTRDRYYVASLMQEAITSSQLEGAATTRKVAKEMLRTGRAPRDRSERMIFNNYRTMRRIAELKDVPLTKEIVFELHQVITNETLSHADEAGRFRTNNEPVRVYDEENQVLHNPPPADQLERRMRSMCEFANVESPSAFVHPVIRSIALHFWLAYDHPFVDGNGRVARALFYWSMLKHGYWLAEFVSISEILVRAPSKYGRAFLYTETDDNDLTYFILFHLDVLVRAIGELHKYVQKKSDEVRALDRMLQRTSHLNHRQRALVSHAIRHPETVYTIESHRSSHDVVYQTARTDLLQLVDHGLLEGGKIGKTWYFRAVPDLQSKLVNF